MNDATASFLARVEAEVARITSEGSWGNERDEALETAFKKATERALRVPFVIERSTRLRRVARVVIPPRLRPLVRRVVSLRHGFARR